MIVPCTHTLSCTFLDVSPTFMVPLILPFLILSSFVTQHIHLIGVRSAVVVCSEAKYGSLMYSVQLVDGVCLGWSLLVLVVDPSSVATSPPVMPYLPILRLYDLLGCSVGSAHIETHPSKCSNISETHYELLYDGISRGETSMVL